MATPKGPFYRALGNKLAEARRKAKLTQAGLARAVGLSRTSITNIEKGRQAVQAHLIVRLAEALGTTVLSLLPSRRLAPDSALGSQLRHLPYSKREWVKRIIATEVESGSEVCTSQAEGEAPPRGGRGN